MLVGLCIFAYPFVSNGYYTWVQRQANQAYFDETGKQDQANQAAIKEEMTAYNQRLAEEKYQELEMPFLKAQREHLTDSKSQELGEVLSVVEIPKIRVELPVYNGTSDLQLQYGAGLLQGTSMPIGGESSHSVITGHRGLTSAKLFTDLPKLEKGDQFYLHLQDEIHAYEVDQIKVVEPTEMDDLKIVQGEDYVTLLTCTPYMINTHRLLVRGHRVPYEKDQRLKAIHEAKKHFWIEIALYILGILLVLAFVIWRKKRKKRKNEIKKSLDKRMNERS